MSYKENINPTLYPLKVTPTPNPPPTPKSPIFGVSPPPPNYSNDVPSLQSGGPPGPQRVPCKDPPPTTTGTPSDALLLQRAGRVAPPPKALPMPGSWVGGGDYYGERGGHSAMG